MVFNMFVGAVRTTFWILLVSIPAKRAGQQSAQDDFVVTASGTNGLYGGVPFKQWIYGVTVPIPPHMTTGPLGDMPSLSTDGGTCRNLIVDQVVAKDLGYSPAAPGVSYGISGLGAHCEILARERSLTISFDVVDGSADIDIVLDPTRPAGSSYAVPFGGLHVTRCSINGTVQNLNFNGTSMLEPALKMLRTGVEYMINTELPMIACTQLKPQVEAKSNMALKQVTEQLQPLLSGASPSPSPEPAAAVPLIDWGSFPPMQVSRALVAARSGAVADLMARVPTFDVPLQRIPVNRTVTIEARGSVVNTYLESLRIEGIGTFVPASLQIAGAGHTLDFSAAFRQLRVISRLQVQVTALGNAAHAAEPLLEHFELSLDLRDVSAEANTLAMVSQAAFDGMQVDQLQQISCLVDCVRGAALPPGPPLALRQIEQLQVTPAVTMVAPGSLEAGLADVIDTTFAVLLRGYLPAVEALLRTSVDLANRTIDAAVQHFIDMSPSCQRSGVYTGPGDAVDNLLLWASIGIAAFGLSAGVAVGTISEIDPVSPTNNLFGHPCVPRGLAVAFPFMVVSTIFLFVLSDLGLGTVVNVVFTADGHTKMIGPAFSFSVLTIFRDSWLAGAYCIAFLVAGLSGVWPFVKLILLLIAWFVSPQSLRLGTRGKLLTFLDQYGKYSLIDSWLAVLALASYDLTWSRGAASMSVEPLPMLPFFLFVVATVLSLILGHIATEYHKRALEWDDGSLDGFVDRRRPTSFCQQFPGSSHRWVVALALTGVAVVVAGYTVSFQMQSSGAIVELLQDPDDRTISYSLISLGTFITRGDPDPPLGLRTVQIIFFVFAFGIPVCLILALLYLFIVPLQYGTQRATLRLCQVLDAWAAFDVFALAVLVANFEFGTFGKFLVYNDNISVLCNWVKQHLAMDCLHIECRITGGYALMLVAAVASYAVPKQAFRFCQVALSEVDTDADSGPGHSSEGDVSEDEMGVPLKQIW